MKVALLNTDVSMEMLQKEIAFEQRSVIVAGNTYQQPRLTKWYGEKSYSYSGLTWEPAVMPVAVDIVRILVQQATGARFNCCLCNLYRDGSDLIGWHSDDEPEFGSDPEVASVSFGSPRTFRMRRKSNHADKMDFELGDKSLLLMPKGTQSEWQHMVPKTKKITGPRINLTFRYAI
jgi:alkylated DNA repair dioxygenase AlkB